MKKSALFIFLMIVILISGFSQVPDAFNYQSVVRNASGELISNQDVSFKISILQDSESGTPIYVETHSITTNDFGIANLKIGQGTMLSGTFDPAAWGSNLHFLKLEIDAEGGSSYSHMGTSQLLSVPYAFHAQTVAEDQVDDADADATNELQTLSLSGTELSLSEGGGTVDIADKQTLAISGNDLSISDGNTVAIPDMADNWGTQAVESNFSLTGDGTAANPLAVFGNLTDDQTLSISGNDLTISSGNTVALPSSPWKTNGSDIYYNTGNIAIGRTSTSGFLIDAYNSANAGFRIQSSESSYLYLSKGSSDKYAEIAYSSGGGVMFWSGLLGNNYYRISTSSTTLNGIEIESDGDVNLSDELHSANTGTANMMPYAYGHIFDNGSKDLCTSNVGTVTKISTGQYKIEIADLGYSYTAIVTTNHGVAFILTVVTQRYPTHFYVSTWDTKNDGYLDAGFSFIVYKY